MYNNSLKLLDFRYIYIVNQLLFEVFMHFSSLKRMEWFIKNYIEKADKKMSVIDIGSRDINGSCKQLFKDEKYHYTGLDVEAGKNADIIPAHPYRWTEIADETFDVVISCNAFEHIEFFWLVMAEMTRILKKGGYIAIITSKGTISQNYPISCYNFDTDGMIALARYCNLDILHASTNFSPSSEPIWNIPNHASDTFLIAQKPLDWAGMLNIDTYTFTPRTKAKINSTVYSQSSH